MGIGGLFLGVIDAFIVAALMVLLGALIVWLATIFEWPIPWNIQRLYLLVVFLIVIYLIVATMLGMPVVHILPMRAG